jgi:hypothetical protein
MAFNAIIDDLSDLQAQIDALGPSSTPEGPVRIDSLEPSGDVVEKTQLKIHGGGFAVPANLNVVLFDTTPVGSFFPGSTDKLLIVDVPGGIPSLPKPMILSVTSGSDTATRAVRVIPKPPVLTGQIAVTDTSGSVGTILVGQTYAFQFKLDAKNLTASESFEVTALFSGIVGASQKAWEDGTVYVGTSGANHQVTVSPGTPVTVGVSVTVPTGATSADLQVRFKSVHNDPGSSSASQAIPLVVGLAPPQTNPAVSLTLGQIASANLRAAKINNVDGVEVKFGSGPVVRINGVFHEAGTYAFTAVVETPQGADPNVWTVSPVSPASKGEGAEQSDVLEFKLTLVPTSPPALSEQRFLIFTAKRQETTGVGQVSSYWRFPIRGFS